MRVRRGLERTATLTRNSGASSQTYDVGIQTNRRTSNVLQLFSCLPEKLPHMVNMIGPGLYVFVKGLPGKIFELFAATAPLA